MRRNSGSIRLPVVLALASVVAIAAARGDTAPEPPATVAPGGPRVPVLVELFTSEGCSSCPPADAALRELAAEQPVAGARVVALGEHVDYWNYLGWIDRFSSADYTKRQQEYRARAFPGGTIYTPQMVIDGELEAVGSDRRAVRRAIERAAAAAHASVTVASQPAADADRIQVAVDIRTDAQLGRSGPADVLLAVVEDGLETKVRRGENGGRTLTHDGVVRALETVGRLDADATTGSFRSSVALDPDWNRLRLHVVALVQERHALRVLGVGSADLDGG